MNSVIFGIERLLQIECRIFALSNLQLLLVTVVFILMLYLTILNKQGVGLVSPLLSLLSGGFTDKDHQAQLQ